MASGRLPISHASTAGLVLLAGAVATAATVNITSLVVIISYFLLNLAYSLVLKNIVILDVMVIAFGFLLRIAAGAVSIDVSISHWILLTTLFVSLFLGFGKRRKEMLSETGNEDAVNHRSVLEHYSVALLDCLIIISITLTIITYSLYVIDARTVQKLNTDRLILTVPLAVFGLFRYLYLIYRKQMGGDPAEVILRDLPILIDIILWGIASMAILYFANIGTIAP